MAVSSGVMAFFPSFVLIDESRKDGMQYLCRCEVISHVIGSDVIEK